MTRVLLVRHGQSTWNAARRWQGQADAPLSELGILQATAAAERVAELGEFAHVAASDLERAVVTAGAIADRLGLSPIRVEPRLRENHAGEWQGLTHDEIEAEWPGWIEAQRRPPGFEPPDAVAARVAEAVKDLTANAVGDIVAVTHGGSIRCLRRSIGCDDLILGNLAGAWFEVDSRGEISGGETLHLLDETMRSPSWSAAPLRAAVE